MSMTIDQILNALKHQADDATIRFDFCGCFPTTIVSWRGVYSAPAIQWTRDNNDRGILVPTVADFVGELKHATSGEKRYHGYKGMEYFFTRADELHVDNYGEYSSTEIDRITNHEGYSIIHTKRE